MQANTMNPYQTAPIGAADLGPYCKSVTQLPEKINDESR